MNGTRPARPEDAAEVVRLRRLMFAAMTGEDRPGPWERTAEAMLREALALPVQERRYGVFVVEADACGATGGAGGAVPLAACAVGTVEERLPAPPHPEGRFGFVFNVCTDPAYRGRGYARAVTGELLGWMAARGVTRVDLHATPEAEALYRSMGFGEHSVALSADLPLGRAAG